MFYTDCLTSYSSLKTGPYAPAFHSLESKGIRLFDKGQLQYVMSLYESCNKINLLNRQIKDVKMPSKTKNYLLDDLYDPYAARFNQFSNNLSEPEILNVLLRIEGGGKIEQNWRSQIRMFEESILKDSSGDTKAYK